MELKYTAKLRDRNYYLQRNSNYSSLSDKSTKDGIILFCVRCFSLLLHVFISILVARKLNPEDFGLLGMVMVFVLFIGVFRDLGLSTATIQKQYITHYQVSNLFWCNAILGLILSVVLFLISPLISKFYHEPKLLKICMVMSFSFFISNISIQHSAILQRRMNFKRICLINIIGSLFTYIIVLCWIYIYPNYWVLVFLHIGRNIIFTCLLFMFCSWMPSLPHKILKSKSLLNFGIYITGFDLINFFSRNLDKILMGRVYGATLLGYYNKAYEIVLLPISQLRGPITQIAIPALSSLQDKEIEFKKYYLGYTNILASLTYPIAAYMYYFAPDILLFVLGERWLPATKIFKLLGIVMLFQPMIGILGPLLISLGKSKKYFLWGILHSCLIVSGFIIGINGDILYFIKIYIISNMISYVFSICYCLRNSPVNWKEYVMIQLQPIFFSSLGLMILFFIKEILIINNRILYFLFYSIIYGLIYMFQFCLIKNRRNELYNFFKVIFRKHVKKNY